MVVKALFQKSIIVKNLFILKFSLFKELSMDWQRFLSNPSLKSIDGWRLKWIPIKLSLSYHHCLSIIPTKNSMSHLLRILEFIAFDRCSSSYYCK